MDTFKIIKKGSGNFWHVHNNNSKTVNLSDFEIVLDSVSQTFSISMPNGSNVPSFSVSIFYIIVIDETDGSVEETFGSVESLRLRLIELGYTPYISGNNVTEAPIDGLTYGRKDAQWVEIGGGVQQYKFLLSQTGGDDPQTVTSGSLTQGVTYEIVAFETGDDFTLSGAPNNTVGTKWISNGVAPTWSNGSEIGWNGGAPFIIGEITPNTFGRFWFERIDIGYYIIVSDGEFTDGTIDFGSTNALVPGDAGLILRSNKDVNSIEFTTATPALVYHDSMIIENVTTLYKYTPF